VAYVARTGEKQNIRHVFTMTGLSRARSGSPAAWRSIRRDSSRLVRRCPPTSLQPRSGRSPRAALLETSCQCLRGRGRAQRSTKRVASPSGGSIAVASVHQILAE